MKNLSDSSDRLKEFPLPPSLARAESLIAASSVTSAIVKEAALQLHRKALDSYIPGMLTSWYIDSYRSLTEVFPLPL